MDAVEYMEIKEEVANALDYYNLDFFFIVALFYHVSAYLEWVCLQLDSALWNCYPVIFRLCKPYMYTSNNK